MRIDEAAEMCGCKCQRIHQMIAEGLVESRKEYGIQLANLDDVMNLREKFKRRRSISYRNWVVKFNIILELC